jgi:hypothetical protein
VRRLWRVTITTRGEATLYLAADSGADAEALVWGANLRELLRDVSPAELWKENVELEPATWEQAAVDGWLHRHPVLLAGPLPLTLRDTVEDCLIELEEATSEEVVAV